MREPFLENPDLAHPAPIDSEQDIVLHARPGPEGGDEIQAYGALVDGRVEREAPLLGRLVAPASLLEGVRNARRTGSLSARNSSDPRDQLWRSIAQHAPADSSSDLGATLEATLTSTLPPNGPRRRVILNADPSTLLAALPLEGVAIDDSRVFETSRAELLRFVHVEDAPRPIPRAPYLRRHRALVLVGDIEQSSRVTGSTRDLRREVQAVVQALRGAGTEVVVGSVTGRLELTGAVQRPLLLDDRGDDAEREERCRSALREMLSEVPVDVLHYVGHGDEAAESQVGRASTSVSFSLPMRERDRGRSRRIWIEGAELNRWTRRPLRLCTLSACAASPQLAAALCAAAEHVVVMTSRVSPEFTAAWTRALYGRLFDADEPRAIGVAVAEARDALRSIGHDEHAWIPQHYARSLDDAPFSGTRYRALLDRHVSELGVMEGALSAWWQPVDEAWLDRVYVEADIEGAAVPEVPPPEEGLIQDDLPSASWTLDRLARTTPHVLGLERAHFRLVGAAGSGKTTALRIVARRLTRLGERLPIYIRLPQWERHGFGLEFLEEQGLGRDLLEQRAPDLVLLLDGLDEIREHDAFRSLLRKSWFPFDEAALVVAGRATAGSIGDGFQRIDLARLSQARAVELATRVLNIERGQAERDLDGERGTRRADEARKRLARIADHAESAERVVDHLSVHLRHEARVPLFVTMAARLWARGLDITTIGRMKFYEQVLDMLVESGHRETDVTGRPTTALRRAARCLALESLVDVDAMDGFRRGRFGATIETSTLAKQCVPRSSLEDVGEWECTRVRAALLDTGLLAGDARGELEWTHPSFRDALVAEAFIELVQRLGIDEALSVARRVVVDADGPPSALAEALGLAAMGLGRDDDRERWIQHLLDVERATGSEARLASRV
ncbi:MAG: NACHT domain-containing protein, partial [Planctomycetota bacterium]